VYPLRDLAVGKIFSRERNIQAEQAFHRISVGFTLDSEPVLLLASQSADVSSLSGKIISPSVQAFLSEVAYAIERRSFAILGRGILFKQAIELQHETAVSGRAKLSGKLAMGLVLQPQ